MNEEICKDRVLSPGKVRKFGKKDELVLPLPNRYLVLLINANSVAIKNSRICKHDASIPPMIMSQVELFPFPMFSCRFFLDS